jgi:hypothetical protein
MKKKIFFVICKIVFLKFDSLDSWIRHSLYLSLVPFNED